MSTDDIMTLQAYSPSPPPPHSPPPPLTKAEYSNLAFIHNNMSIGDDIDRHTMTLHALKDVEVHSLVVSLCWDFTSLVGIPDHHVSIRTNSDSALWSKGKNKEINIHTQEQNETGNRRLVWTGIQLWICPSGDFTTTWLNLHENEHMLNLMSVT